MKFTYQFLIGFAIIPFILLGVAAYMMQTTYTNIEQKEVKEVQNLIKIQKQKIKSDFTYLFEAVEAYPAISHWSDLSSLNSMNNEQGGIPKSEESEKREAAQFLISDFGFQSFGITLNDGRMYFLEPYEHQTNLSKMNFSDREWFQGVQKIQDTYLSDVFLSAASGHPIVVISTPIFSENGELIAMWGGSLDLEYMNAFFNDIKKKGSSVFLIDENDIVIVNSGSTNPTLSETEIIKVISENQNIPYIHKNENHIFIEKIEVANKNWNMITVITDENLLPFTTDFGKDSYLVIAGMVAFIIGAEFLLFRFLKKNLQLNLSIAENRKLLIKQEKLASIGELASRISHDIRNPLSNIRMSLELIKKKSPDTKISDQTVEKNFQTAFNNIERISHQVNDVLDYVRNRKLDTSPVSLYSSIKDTIQSISLPDNIKIQYDKSDSRVIGDPIQLQIVWNNILTNAIQAIGKNEGEIHVKISEDPEYVNINFENSGPNISDEIMPQIFESLTTTKEIGTGLGLASCKRIIENHGGEISAKNNPTRFVIRLPKS